ELGQALAGYKTVMVGKTALGDRASDVGADLGRADLDPGRPFDPEKDVEEVDRLSVQIAEQRCLRRYVRLVDVHRFDHRTLRNREQLLTCHTWFAPSPKSSSAGRI